MLNPKFHSSVCLVDSIKSTHCLESLTEILWCTFQLAAYDLPLPRNSDFDSQQSKSIQETLRIPPNLQVALLEIIPMRQPQGTLSCIYS